MKGESGERRRGGWRCENEWSLLTLVCFCMAKASSPGACTMALIIFKFTVFITYHRVRR